MQKLPNSLQAAQIVVVAARDDHPGHTPLPQLAYHSGTQKAGATGHNNMLVVPECGIVRPGTHYIP